MTKKPVILDTNAVIRFIAGDDELAFRKVADILINTECHVPVEVLAEVVYNLRDKYSYPRQLITDKLKDFITTKDNITSEINVVFYGLNLYAATNLDFVDCLLDGYAKTGDNFVFTFDTALRKQLAEKAYPG
ncbi:MAG: PIN domain-containing protein [Spirochaetaceae bacterium]|jgi:predicted nucleic-acid-binding protein|nr:PIN domain-containing protein [Spirochaetaceae bacterium]